MSNDTMKIGITNTPENRGKLKLYVESLPAMEKAGVLCSLWEGTKDTFEGLLKNVIDNAPIAETLEEDFGAYDFGIAETMDNLTQSLIEFGTAVHDVIENAKADMIGNVLALTLGIETEGNLPDGVGVDEVIDKTNERINEFCKQDSGRLKEIINDLMEFSEILE